MEKDMVFLKDTEPADVAKWNIIQCYVMLCCETGVRQSEMHSIK